MQDLVHGFIQILKGQMADFREILCFITTRFNVIGDINDLFKDGHICLTCCMVADGIQDGRIIDSVFLFRNINSDFGMENGFILFLPSGEGNVVLLADLELFSGWNAFGTVVKQAGHLSSDKIFSMTHGKSCCCVHHTLRMYETVAGEIFFQSVHSITRSYKKDVGISETTFHKGSLRSGQRIEVEGSIVVIGDVNSGAEVIAADNIVVIGTLRGLAHAGAKGNKEAIIAASTLDAVQLRISNIVREIDRDEEEIREHAYIYVSDDKIVIE